MPVMNFHQLCKINYFQLIPCTGNPPRFSSAGPPILRRDWYIVFFQKNSYSKGIFFFQAITAFSSAGITVIEMEAVYVTNIGVYPFSASKNTLEKIIS